jgi:uncharacterized protein
VTVEAQPVDLACNLRCAYCYEECFRATRKVPHYNLDAMTRRLRDAGQPFVLFGGESLLMPLRDLEVLWRLGSEIWSELPLDARQNKSENGIQTNGTLITPDHIAAFLDHKVTVGVSIDGPGELNSARCGPALTERTALAIDAMLKAGVPVCISIVLSRVNASPERLPRLVQWVDELSARGVSSIDAQLLQADTPASEAIALSESETIAAMQALRRHLYVFRVMARLLRAQEEDKIQCAWDACDPWNTSGVHAVDSRGNMQACSRVGAMQRAEKIGHARQLVLHGTPQEDGGCQGCRFFVVCKGQCPGHAIGGDWRNRSRHCGVWKSLLSEVEYDLLRVYSMPVTRRPDLAKIEAVMLEGWARGGHPTIAQAISVVEGHAAPVSTPPGDRPHGDVPHADHTDAALLTIIRQALGGERVAC